MDYMKQPTVESVTKLLKFFKIKLEEIDKNIYPIECLGIIMHLLNLVITTKSLEKCLEQDSVRALIELVKNRIMPPDFPTLLYRGYNMDDFDQIQLYTDIFKEVMCKVSNSV